METRRAFAIVGILAVCFASTPDQAQAQQPVTQSNNRSRSARRGDETRLSDLVAQARPRSRAGFVLMPESLLANSSGPAFVITPSAAGPNLAVMGGGTVGRLTKWTGFSSSNSIIGDTTIYEDKFGKVGIGTDTPTSRLTVSGMIQSTGGGFQFPDGTVQTTSASGALFTVAHNATLTGDGTNVSLLGVTVPLVLTGSNIDNSILKAANTAVLGVGISAIAGERGEGVRAVGGDSNNGFAGDGVSARGGKSNFAGGVGVAATGGDGDEIGGDGVFAIGGSGTGAGNRGGVGIFAARGRGIDGASFGRAGEF